MPPKSCPHASALAIAAAAVCLSRVVEVRGQKTIPGAEGARPPPAPLRLPSAPLPLRSPGLVHPCRPPNTLVVGMLLGSAQILFGGRAHFATR